MKQRLYAKPAKAPRWWPRDPDGRPRWVGILAGGIGWVVGDGPLMTSKGVKEAREIFASEQVDDRGRRKTFRFKTEREK